MKRLISFLTIQTDSDNLDEELAEWYTYSEEPEYLWNLKAFNEKYFKQNRNILTKKRRNVFQKFVLIVYFSPIKM